MATTKKELLNELLNLPADMRSEIIEILIKSLNVPTQKDIDEVWSKEAERRLDDYEKGKLNALPGEKVINSIKERLQK